MDQRVFAECCVPHASAAAVVRHLCCITREACTHPQLQVRAQAGGRGTRPGAAAARQGCGRRNGHGAEARARVSMHAGLPAEALGDWPMGCSLASLHVHAWTACFIAAGRRRNALPPPCPPISLRLPARLPASPPPPLPLWRSLSAMAEAVMMVDCATDAWLLRWANTNFVKLTGARRQSRVGGALGRCLLASGLAAAGCRHGQWRHARLLLHACPNPSF